MRYFVTFDGQDGREIALDVTRSATGAWSVQSDDVALEIDVLSTGASLSVRVNGQVFDLLLDGSGPELAYALGRTRGAANDIGRTRGAATVTGERERADVARAALPAHATSARATALNAPMPGRVVRVLATPDQLVSKGTPLVVVEAMKMENELCATSDGQVLAVLVKPGDAVERGALLVTFS